MAQPRLTKKLIEVALPLEAINAASAREKSIRHGHPSTLHLWWARRPLAAARAVIFAQMVDDPSSHPDLFPTAEAQDGERQRLFRLMEQLVLWENTTNEALLQQARDEIWTSWRREVASRREELENRRTELGAEEYARQLALFDPEKLPAFHDPFAGGGALPLEAQRLGLEAYASDLNPVAVLINKAMIEIPPKFAGMPPVSLVNRRQEGGNRGEERGQEGGNRGEGDAFQGIDCVAEGDARSAGGVPSRSTPATRGDLRHAFADHASGGLHSGEYCGGVGTRIESGEGAVSGCGAGVAGGTGDAADALRADRVVSSERDGGVTQFDERSGADTHNDASPTTGGWQVGENRPETLTTISYLLPSISYKGAQGLAEDVRYYGQWMRDEAERRIGHLYPKVKITAEVAEGRRDLLPYVGKELTVIAWLWARTVKSPNPAFGDLHVPLVSNFMLSTKAGKEAYVEPVVEGKSYRFTVKVGKPEDAAAAKMGTKLARGANFRCLMSDTPIAGDYIKAEGVAGRMGARLMAIVAEGNRGRVYLAPTSEHEAIARQAQPEWEPETPLPNDPRNFWTVQYGLTTFGDLFTPRQLVALNTFAELVQEARERVRRDALAFLTAEGAELRRGCGTADSLRPSASSAVDHDRPLAEGGLGASAYADAVAVYLGMSISKLSDAQSNLCRWKTTMDQSISTFGRQALPMVWDYSEANVFGEMAGDPLVSLKNMMRVVDQFSSIFSGQVHQINAQIQNISCNKIISTDPPYYDNIGYADLSDFFYVWLRHTLRPIFPDLFATLAVPKAEELVATPYRHGGKEQAEQFFLAGMTKAMARLAEQAHHTFPVTIYYAFKQAETDKGDGTSSTGWETFLDAVIRAGFSISGTWPMRTELSNRMIGSGHNALASSIVLVCRARPKDAPVATRRDFIVALKRELPAALRLLQGLARPAEQHASLPPTSSLLLPSTNIAPVDLAQAAIGPGMGIFTRYRQVLEANGTPLSVREALTMINATLDEVLAEQEGDFDVETRWAITWFEQYGFNESEYGTAETLATARNTSVSGMVEAGIIRAKAGRVRLLKPEELPLLLGDAPALSRKQASNRLTTWEVAHQLVQTLNTKGEAASATLMAEIGPASEFARELAYRLYAICERKKRASEALGYNSLVISWPEIARLAFQQKQDTLTQGNLFTAE